MRLMNRLGVVAALVAAPLIAPVAAHADSGSACDRFPEPDFDRGMYTCSSIETNPGWARNLYRVNIGPDFSTSADGCLLRSWMVLRNASGHTWRSPGEATSCYRVLHHARGEWATETEETRTSATAVQGHACTDLTWVSGAVRTRCTETGWIAVR